MKDKDRIIEQLRRENQELHRVVHLLNSRLGALTADSARDGPVSPCVCDSVCPGEVEMSGAAVELQPELGHEHDQTQKIGQLAQVCCELQQIQGNDPFWLSCRHAGAILGVSHTQTAKYLQELVSAGVLQVVEDHKSNRATQYRYVEKAEVEPILS